MKPLGIPTETAAFFVSVAKSYAESPLISTVLEKFVLKEEKSPSELGPAWITSMVMVMVSVLL